MSTGCAPLSSGAAQRAPSRRRTPGWSRSRSWTWEWGSRPWYRADGEYDVDTVAYAYANLAAQMVGAPLS